MPDDPLLDRLARYGPALDASAAPVGVDEVAVSDMVAAPTLPRTRRRVLIAAGVAVVVIALNVVGYVMTRDDEHAPTRVAGTSTTLPRERDGYLPNTGALGAPVKGRVTRAVGGYPGEPMVGVAFDRASLRTVAFDAHIDFEREVALIIAVPFCAPRLTDIGVDGSTIRYTVVSAQGPTASCASPLRIAMVVALRRDELGTQRLTLEPSDCEDACPHVTLDPSTTDGAVLVGAEGSRARQSSCTLTNGTLELQRESADGPVGAGQLTLAPYPPGPNRNLALLDPSSAPLGASRRSTVEVGLIDNPLIAFPGDTIVASNRACRVNYLVRQVLIGPLNEVPPADAPQLVLIQNVPPDEKWIVVADLNAP